MASTQTFASMTILNSRLGSALTPQTKSLTFSSSFGSLPITKIISQDRKQSNSQRLAIVAEASERALWFPGSTPPAHLDGTLPCDFGFDPLNLASEPEDLRWYVQAELVHARFAMLGVAGILYTDFLRVTGIKNLPVWFEAGAAKYEIADTQTLFAVQLLLFGFVEMKRYMDFRNPGSQGKESSWFFGIENAFVGSANGYPGGPVFDPAGLARSDEMGGYTMKVKELKNGRLAMLAALGIFVQAQYTHAGPIENLLAHLADPGHVTIIQTLAK